MALDYAGSAALMTDTAFRGRVKVACLKFASFIADEVGTTSGHNARFRWAQNCLVNPDQTSITVQAPVVMDPAVQSSGDQIDDASLQTAVETVVQQMI
jgi:hypothetical protein